MRNPEPEFLFPLYASLISGPAMRIADPLSHSLIYEHPSGGRLYQSGYQGVPEDPAEIDVTLIVTASKKYRRGEKHENVLFATFKDARGMPAWEWRWIEETVVPAVQQMAETLRRGKGVLSVCRAGLNRSSVLTGLVLREVSDLPPMEIVKLIREKRGVDCLHNPEFTNVVLHGF